MKTILAMPFVLDGEEGKVIISGRGTDYIIAFSIDQIRQQLANVVADHKASVVCGRPGIGKSRLVAEWSVGSQRAEFWSQGRPSRTVNTPPSKRT